MKQTWAVGISASDPRAIETISSTGQHSLIDLKAAIKDGIPSPKKSGRLVFEGEFSSWAPGSAEEYLAGFGMALPEGRENRHEVFTLKAANGATVHVPALVLMRAFFKPHRFLLPAVFSPAGLNLLSFVDYSTTPPSVVIDDAACAKHVAETFKGANKDRALIWLQFSKSAHKAAQSAFQNALVGKLGLVLPSGRTRIVFHGYRGGQHLYASKATLISVEIEEQDNIAGTSEKIIFHALADPKWEPAACAISLQVPLHLDGSTRLTQAEWEYIEPILKGKKVVPMRHSQRELLDVLLYKLASRLPWTKVSKGNFAVTNLTRAFGSWSTSGRLEKILAYLRTTRISMP